MRAQAQQDRRPSHGHTSDMDRRPSHHGFEQHMPKSYHLLSSNNMVTTLPRLRTENLTEAVTRTSSLAPSISRQYQARVYVEELKFDILLCT